MASLSSKLSGQNFGELQPLTAMSKHHGTNVFAFRDDLFGGPGLMTAFGGTKLRKLLALMQYDPRLEEVDAFVTTGNLQSNHARQLAYLCNMLQLPCHIVYENNSGLSTPAYLTGGNRQLASMFGATHEVVSSKDEVATAVAKAMHAYEAFGKTPYFSPRGGSHCLGDAAYIVVGRRIQHLVDCWDKHVTDGASTVDRLHIYVCSGSGGTQAGLTIGTSCEVQKFTTRVIGVSNKASTLDQAHEVNSCIDSLYENVAEVDSETYSVARKIKSESFYPIDANNLFSKANKSFYKDNVLVDDRFAFDPAYGSMPMSVYSACNRAAQNCGFIPDPIYSAKAYMAMESDLASRRYGPRDAVVFMQTGTPFNLFAFSSQFH